MLPLLESALLCDPHAVPEYVPNSSLPKGIHSRLRPISLAYWIQLLPHLLHHLRWTSLVLFFSRLSAYFIASSVGLLVHRCTFFPLRKSSSIFTHICKMPSLSRMSCCLWYCSSQASNPSASAGEGDRQTDELNLSSRSIKRVLGTSPRNHGRKTPSMGSSNQ